MVGDTRVPWFACCLIFGIHLSAECVVARDAPEPALDATALDAVTALSTERDGKCSNAEDGACPAAGGQEAQGPQQSVEAANASTGPGVRKVRNKDLRPSPIALSVLFAIFGGVVIWIVMILRYALDGSLAARLALWGLLPEVCAAISVRSIAALLRLKHGETPVVVLQNCVTDANAKELADAMRRYGKTAGLQALELPRNPALTSVGVRELVAAVLDESSEVVEFDISYNPQLGDDVLDALSPLCTSKKCKVNTLKIADCGITAEGMHRLAKAAGASKLRTIDISYTDLAGASDALVAICEIPVLEELTASGCRLGPAEVATIAEQLPYTGIRSLQLGGNGFGDEGLRSLAKNLPSSQVDELGLEHNRIGRDVLSELGTAWAMRPFSRMRLSGNMMTQAELSSFLKTLKSIHA